MFVKAPPGDTISIGKGKFPECVLIAKNLTHNGAGIFSTRVVGHLTCSSTFKVDSGVDVTITGLDVMGGNAQYGGGILNHGFLILERVRARPGGPGVGIDANVQEPS